MAVPHVGVSGEDKPVHCLVIGMNDDCIISLKSLSNLSKSLNLFTLQFQFVKNISLTFITMFALQTNHFFHIHEIGEHFVKIIFLHLLFQILLSLVMLTLQNVGLLHL